MKTCPYCNFENENDVRFKIVADRVWYQCERCSSYSLLEKAPVILMLEKNKDIVDNIREHFKEAYVIHVESEEHAMGILLSVSSIDIVMSDYLDRSQNWLTFLSATSGPKKYILTGYPVAKEIPNVEIIDKGSNFYDRKLEHMI